MSAPTPGPWRAVGARVFAQTRAGKAAVISDADSPYVADAEANALLIAAAPDMLAALRAVVAAHDEWTAAVGRDGRFDDPLNDACEHARDLIAKVEGR
jgi:hypothetical protein